MEFIDYDGVAAIYDLYSATDYDLKFFTQRIHRGSRVLELTSGTGRLSIPLIEAGAKLTCVDISSGMLAVLAEKLKRKRLSAELVCADAQHLNLDTDFDLAIVPFQAFMEFVGEVKQLNTLRSVYRALIPGGRFFCTMHNPRIRAKSVDAIVRGMGTFPWQQGTIAVSGFETGGKPVVYRSQFFEYFDESGLLVKKQHQKMQFELIEQSHFRQMAGEVGFSIIHLYGDYEAGDFDSQTSPVMIWELVK